MLLCCVTPVKSTDVLRKKHRHWFPVSYFPLLLRFGDIWAEESPNFELGWTAIAPMLTFMADGKDAMMWAIRLMLLCSSREPYSANVATKLPTPAELSKMNQCNLKFFAAWGLLHLGAQAYQKTGDDGKAAELARLGVEESTNAMEILGCHRVLAEISHGRGEAEEAEREFRTAVEQARSCGMNYLALLCVRDLKKLVLDSDGRGVEGDAMIDGVCALMGKTREQFAEVL